ncbi:MAG: TadE/TadG family type IV pilus assembly protein, partial [Bdellovibrionota bacterium]
MFTTGSSKKQHLLKLTKVPPSLPYIIHFKRASGYSLLEVALTLPILFIIMIGAYDVSTAYHGYTALREGVEAANRCTWTTDGKCSSFNLSDGGTS